MNTPEDLIQAEINGLKINIQKINESAPVYKEVQEIVDVCNTFEFPIKIYNVSIKCVTLRIDGKKCNQLLPIFEYLDQKGFEFSYSYDYPDAFNRDYHLFRNSDGFMVKVEAYFNKLECEVIEEESEPTPNVTKTLVCNNGA